MYKSAIHLLMNRNQIIEFFQSEGRIHFEELTNLEFDFKKDFDPEKLNRFYPHAGDYLRPIQGDRKSACNGPKRF